MCRRNHLWGWVLIAFGAGLLLGLFLESGFFCAVIGLGLMALGIWCFGRK
jgi:hypothetical protein